MKVKRGLIAHNPMDIVFTQCMRRNTEQCLKRMFALAFYAGMRQNEFYSAKIEGDLSDTVGKYYY